MPKLLSLFSAAALLALGGCMHDARDANNPPRPESDTMQSQTNDIGQPFPSSPTFRNSRPNGVDSSGRPPSEYPDRTGLPATNSSNPPDSGAGIPATP